MVNKVRAFVEGHKAVVSSFFCSLLLFITIFPVFIHNMTIPRQIGAVCALSLASLYVMWLLKIKLEFVGRGIKWFTIACVIITVIWQIITQIRYHSFGVPFALWRFIFYYDKPFDVAVALTVVALVPTLFRLFLRGKRDTAEWRKTYRVFLKDALTAFSILYISILIFGFILNRQSSEQVTINLVPFKTMFEYITSDKEFAYENTFLFMGNVAILLPLGFWFAIKKKKRRILLTLLLPVFVSCVIELSQYLLKNGHIDIDDVILNVVGFYIGVLLKACVDFIRKKVTRGEEKTIFSL